MTKNDLVDLFVKNLKLQEWQTKMLHRFLMLRLKVRLGCQKKIKPLSEKRKIKMLGYKSNFMVIDEFVTADKEEKNEKDTNTI